MRKFDMPLRRFHLIMKCLGFSFSGKAKEREAWNYRRYDGVHVIAIVNGDPLIIKAHKDILRLALTGKYVSSHNVDESYNENSFFEEFERFLEFSDEDLWKKNAELEERLARMKRAKT